MPGVEDSPFYGHSSHVTSERKKEVAGLEHPGLSLEHMPHKAGGLALLGPLV